jgi:integrase
MKQKRLKRAVLELDDIINIRAALSTLGPLPTALFEWIYTNGQRASEPGQTKMDDVDLRAGRIQLVHLKGGLPPEPVAIATRCRKALAAWFKVRPQGTEYVFPANSPGRCYTCKGSGTRLDNKQQPRPCHHCEATGKRWGLSRYEVAGILDEVFAAGGVPERLRFPHVLRHSAVTHMLNAGWSPADIRMRVGHRSVETTYGYMQATKKAQSDLDRALGGLEPDDEEDDE